MNYLVLVKNKFIHEPIIVSQSAKNDDTVKIIFK